MGRQQHLATRAHYLESQFNNYPTTTTSGIRGKAFRVTQQDFQTNSNKQIRHLLEILHIYTMNNAIPTNYPQTFFLGGGGGGYRNPLHNLSGRILWSLYARETVGKQAPASKILQVENQYSRKRENGLGAQFTNFTSHFTCCCPLAPRSPRPGKGFKCPLAPRPPPPPPVSRRSAIAAVHLQTGWGARPDWWWEQGSRRRAIPA